MEFGVYCFEISVGFRLRYFGNDPNFLKDYYKIKPIKTETLIMNTNKVARPLTRAFFNISNQGFSVFQNKKIFLGAINFHKVP